MQVPGLKLEALDLKYEVPNLRFGWIRLNLITVKEVLEADV